MDFKVGQKYRIVDIDAWWDDDMYDETIIEHTIIGKFSNGDVIEIKHADNGMALIFVLASNHNKGSMYIEDLVSDIMWHDSCIELITDDIADVSKMEEESDDTISLYHIADVLEDALFENERPSIIYEQQELRDKIKLCIDSLRKAGY